MLAFVHEQIKQARDGTREALEALNRQLELAHGAALRFKASLPNRDEALVELNLEANELESGVNRYAGLFVVDALPALRSRHGNEVSEQLLREIGHTHLNSVVPGGKVFRWSAQSVLAVWSSRKKLVDVSSAAARSCQAPFDCYAFVGTRTATFNISIRPSIWDARVSATKLTRAFDEFSQGAETK